MRVKVLNSDLSAGNKTDYPDILIMGDGDWIYHPHNRVVPTVGKHENLRCS